MQGAIVNLLALLALSSIQIVICQEVVEPKLVCYYTNWAKDRPDPWSYVSKLVGLREENSIIGTH